MVCKVCGKSLTYNEMGLSKKLLGKGITSFFCKSCLASYLEVSVARLEEKQKQFLKAGCCLFVEEN